VTHTLTTNLSLSYLNATLLTDHTTVLETLVLTTQALIVFHRAKNFGTEQTVTLGLKGTVVNSFWLFHLAK
jgi:hypothetical protein